MCLAIPGRVLSITDDALRSARVDFGGVVKPISLALLPEACVGDHVLVHAGLGLQVIDEAAARDVFAAVAELERGLAGSDSESESDPEPAPASGSTS